MLRARWHSCLGGSLLVVGIAASASAQTPAYVDDRLDRFEFPVGSPLSRAAEAVMFHYGRSQFTPGPGGTYQIHVHPRTEEAPGQPWCPSVRFYGQPQSSGGTTAVIVGKRHVLTANHTLPAGATASSRVFVFGYELTQPWVPGTPASTFTFAASNVYFGETIVHQDYSNDWALIRLDRDVPSSRRPLVMRSRSGLAPGESAVLLGFPEHIPLKGQDVEVTDTHVSQGGYQVINVAGLSRQGSSGGPIVGHRTGVLEGITITALGALGWSPKCGAWVDVFEPPPWTSCVFPLGASALIPPQGLQVAPELEQVFEYYGPLGGPFSSDTMRVDLSSPADTVGVLTWRASSLDPDRVGIVGPLARTPRQSVQADLQPGQSMPVLEQMVRLWEWTNTPGVHDARVEFRDITLETSGIHTHRVHAGIDGFIVEPLSGIGLDSPGAPPETRAVYTLTNRHRVPQTVIVEVSDSWILANGKSGAQQVVIPASPSSGTPGTLDIEITFDASDVRPGVLTGDIRFRPWIPGWEGQAELGAVHRAVRVDFGREVFASGDIPVVFPVPGNGTVQVMVDRLIGLVADLDVSYRLESTANPEAMIARITLISPAGTTLPLHTVRLRAGDPALGVLDDETAPATLGSLSQFDGEVVTGVWTVLFEMSNPDGSPTDCTIRDFSLRVTPSLLE